MKERDSDRSTTRDCSRVQPGNGSSMPVHAFGSGGDVRHSVPWGGSEPGATGPELVDVSGRAGSASLVQLIGRQTYLLDDRVGGIDAREVVTLVAIGIVDMLERQDVEKLQQKAMLAPRDHGGSRDLIGDRGGQARPAWPRQQRGEIDQCIVALRNERPQGRCGIGCEFCEAGANLSNMIVLLSFRHSGRVKSLPSCPSSHRRLAAVVRSASRPEEVERTAGGRRRINISLSPPSRKPGRYLAQKRNLAAHPKSLHPRFSAANRIDRSPRLNGQHTSRFACDANGRGCSLRGCFARSRERHASTRPACRSASNADRSLQHPALRCEVP